MTRAQGFLTDQAKAFTAALDRVAPTAVSDLNDAAIDQLRRNRAIRLLRERRRRNAFFDEKTLFGEPAWDLLLQIYADELVGRPCAAGAAVSTAIVPTTTALRRLHGLSTAGHIVRAKDPADGRRTLITLSPKCRAAMNAYIDGLLA